MTGVGQLMVMLAGVVALVAAADIGASWIVIEPQQLHVLLASGLLLAAVAATVTVMAWRLVKSNRDRDIALKQLAAAKEALERKIEKRTAQLHHVTSEEQRSTRLLLDTLNSMEDPVLIYDRDGKLTLINEAAAKDFGPMEEIGTEKWWQTHKVLAADGTPLQRDERPIGRIIRGERVTNLLAIVESQTLKRRRNYRVTANTIRDANGQPEGFIVIHRDVTDLHETEKQLRYAQKMEAIGQLTGGIAHDFNNILTVIMGTIGMVRDAVADDADLSEIARMIDEAAGRGADLTQDLLAFARKQPLQPRSVDVTDLLTSVSKLLRPTIGEQIEIELLSSPSTPPVLADPSQLTTAILNLAVNARDAMPRGGKIVIETDEYIFDAAQANALDLSPGAYVMIAVTDNGCGMPTAVSDRIFEPFFTTKPVGNGTGLGLSMVYGFVKQSNGHIQVYSEPGYGTCFKMYFPLADDVPLIRDETPDSSILPTGSEYILVVEDDQLVGEFVTRQLGLLGYRSKLVASAAAALELFDGTESFDLLLTDIILPGGVNGRELAQEVRRRCPDIRVVFTSGYSEDALIHHGRLDSDVLLLSKPYRKSQLANVLRKALDGTASAA